VGQTRSRRATAGDAPGAIAGLAAAASGAVPWLAGVAVLVVGLAIHVYRESRREFVEAETRVSFVNQVSHELKTPLTNVRMYAELLEAEVAEEPVAARYAGVIVGEAQRLSRLIGNVLAFARHERHELHLRRRDGILDEVVARVLATFGPALAARGIAIEATLQAPELCQLDADACEQILGNLLSNIEKYAAEGGVARVTTARRGGFAYLLVADRGPGVPAAARQRIFRPFFRISNALTDGVSGAGLGLTIARELARLHGGDLVLRESAAGAVFEARLAVGDAAADGGTAGEEKR
jgi:signal transduction histidine kinase